MLLSCILCCFYPSLPFSYLRGCLMSVGIVLEMKVSSLPVRKEKVGPSL